MISRLLPHELTSIRGLLGDYLGRPSNSRDITAHNLVDLRRDGQMQLGKAW